MRQLRRRQPGNRRGFTLIEAVATIVVLAVIGTVATNIILVSTDGYTQAATSAQLHTELSIALDRIVRELRMIGLDPGASGVAPDILQVRSDSISWDAGPELKRLNGSVVFSPNGPPFQVLLEDVIAFSIRPFDESNIELATPISGPACDVVRRLEISITLQRSGVSETLRARTFLRCTMAGAGTGG